MTAKANMAIAIGKYISFVTVVGITHIPKVGSGDIPEGQVLIHFELYKYFPDLQLVQLVVIPSHVKHD